MRRLKLAAACAGALALAGCAKGGGEANTAAPAATSTGTSVADADLPRLRAGYWEEIETLPGGSPHARHFCAGGRPVSLEGLAKGCGALTVRRTPAGAFQVDAACGKGVIVTTLHAIFSGDFTTAYVGDTTVTMKIVGYPPKSLTSHSRSRYLGACPPAMSPDD